MTPESVLIDEVQSTDSIGALVARKSSPIRVLGGSKGNFVAISQDEYERLQDQASLAAFYERILIAEQERREGNLIDAREDIAELRRIYDL